MSKWNRNTYNWTRAEEREKAVFKLWVVWIPSAAMLRKVHNPNGVREYYGKYLMPDYGEQQLIEIIEKVPMEFFRAQLYKNGILTRKWKQGFIEVSIIKK
jgi:hypothetical protein